MTWYEPCCPSFADKKGHLSCSPVFFDVSLAVTVLMYLAVKAVPPWTHYIKVVKINVLPYLVAHRVGNANLVLLWESSHSNLALLSRQNERQHSKAEQDTTVKQSPDSILWLNTQSLSPWSAVLIDLSTPWNGQSMLNMHTGVCVALIPCILYFWTSM